MIRKATSADVDAIVTIGRVFFSEAGWDDITKWNDELATESISRFITNDDCVIMVAEDDGEIVGMIGAFASAIWFSGELLWQELFWYVKPDRRGGLGIKLLNALEREFEERGVLIGSMFTVDKINHMKNFFIKRGYRASEHSYIRRI